MKCASALTFLVFAAGGAFVGSLYHVNYYSQPTVDENVLAGVPNDFSEEPLELLKTILALNRNAPHPWGSKESELVAQYIKEFAEETAKEFGTERRIVVEFTNYTSNSAWYDIDFLTDDLDPQNHRSLPEFIEDRSLPDDFKCTCKTCGAFADLPCQIQNIVVFIEGDVVTGDGKGVQVSAHHDSELNSPGASDDGTGLVTVLTMMRKVAKYGAKRDTVFALFDGEEAGLLGSYLYTKQSQFRDVTSVTINIEAGGLATRDYLLKTNSDFLDRIYGKYAPHKLAYSFISWINSLLQVGYTDTINMAKQGQHHIDLTFLEKRWGYHRSFDNIRQVPREALYRVIDNVDGLLYGIMDEDIPERYPAGHMRVHPNATNEITPEDITVTSPKIVYTTVWGTMISFASNTGTSVLFCVLAVLFGVLLVVGDLASCKQRSMRRDGIIRNFFKLLALLMVSFVSSYMVYATVDYASNDQFDQKYFGERENSARVGATSLSALLAQSLALWIWSSRLSREDWRLVPATGSVDMESQSSSKDDTPDSDEYSFISGVSSNIFTVVGLFYCALLFVVGVGGVHLAPTFFWTPMFFVIARALQLVGEKFGLALSVSDAIRDVIGMFIPVVFMVDTLSVLSLTFPYFLAKSFAPVVGLLSSVLILMFSPLVVRLVGGSELLRNVAFVVIGFEWLVINVLLLAKFQANVY